MAFWGYTMQEPILDDSVRKYIDNAEKYVLRRVESKDSQGRKVASITAEKKGFFTTCKQLLFRSSYNDQKICDVLKQVPIASLNLDTANITNLVQRVIGGVEAESIATSVTNKQAELLNRLKDSEKAKIMWDAGEDCSLKKLGLSTPKELIDYAIDHEIAIVDLREFDPVTRNDVSRLFKDCQALQYVYLGTSYRDTDLPELPKQLKGLHFASSRSFPVDPQCSWVRMPAWVLKVPNDSQLRDFFCDVKKWDVDIPSLPHLEKLHLRHCRRIQMSQLPLLKELLLSHCEFIPHSLTHQMVPQLEVLHLADIKWGYPSIISDLYRLRSCTLSSCIVTAIRNMPQLRKLEITDSHIRSIGYLENLETVRLTNCEIGTVYVLSAKNKFVHKTHIQEQQVEPVDSRLKALADQNIEWYSADMYKKLTAKTPEERDLCLAALGSLSPEMRNWILRFTPFIPDAEIVQHVQAFAALPVEKQEKLRSILNGEEQAKDFTSYYLPWDTYDVVFTLRTLEKQSPEKRAIFIDKIAEFPEGARKSIIQAIAEEKMPL